MKYQLITRTANPNNLPCCEGTSNEEGKQFTIEECTRNNGTGWK